MQQPAGAPADERQRDAEDRAEHPRQPVVHAGHLVAEGDEDVDEQRVGSEHAEELRNFLIYGITCLMLSLWRTEVLDLIE